MQQRSPAQHPLQEAPPRRWRRAASAVGAATLVVSLVACTGKHNNGATRVVPGSHLLGHGPDYGNLPETVPVTGPAGTVMVFDGRLWHQTGPNTTAGERRHGVLAYYCRPFMRQQENWFVSLKPEVLDRATPTLRHLLGWDHYFSLGMIDGMPRGGMRY